MEAKEFEIEINLDTNKPLGFRLAQPLSDGACSNGISLKIAQVRRKSQAYKQGLKPNDIIVHIRDYGGKLAYDEVMDWFRDRQKVNGATVVTVKRGREYGDNEPVLCISHKPTTATVTHSTSGAGSSSPTPANSTNVCCVHGVQSKPSTASAPVEQAHKRPPPPPAAAAPKKEEKPSGGEESGGSKLSSLFNFFKKDTTSSETSTATESVSRTKPPAPPPPVHVPKSTTATTAKKEDEQEQQSWIQRAFQFTESFTTKGGKSEEKKSTETTNKSSHRSTLSTESVSTPPAPYIIKTTPVASMLPPPPMMSSTYDVDNNMRYPGAFGSGGSDSYSKTSSLFVRTTGSGVSPPSPIAVPEVTIGQSTVQIQVKPRHDYMSSSYTQDGADSGRSRTAVWTAEPTLSPSGGGGESYYTRSSQKYTSTTTSSGADENSAAVQSRRRQWPPPSNASGVEIVKDMWLHGTGGSVADLDASPVAPEPRYESYTSTTTTRDYGGGVQQPSSTGDIAVDELAESVTAAALRKSKFGDQLAEQVRMCHTIARSLNSPVDKPSKAQRMFTSRKNRMEKWVLSSPPPSSIPEEAASASSESSPSYRTFEPIRNTDTFEVIRSTPHNQQLYVDSNNAYDDSNALAEYVNDGTVPVEHYKKYSRYSYKSTSSYQSAVDNENDLHQTKQIRYPSGEVHDYQKLTTKDYGDKISTNMPGAEKCHELSHTLNSDSSTGKGVEMFHRRRQKAEDWVVDSSKSSRVASSTLPPVAPRRTLANVDPADVIESVREAAARKEEETFSPSSRNRLTFTPVPVEQSRHTTHHHHASLNELMDGGGSTNLKSPTPPVWGHERLFSPTPFAYQSTPRPYTPMEFGGRRTPLPDSHYGDITTSVVALSTPSTRIVANVDQNAISSKINTLPRSWKSFSSAYKQNYNS